MEEETEQYKRIRKIGSGGFGTVYLAEDAAGRQYAVWTCLRYVRSVPCVISVICIVQKGSRSSNSNRVSNNRRNETGSTLWS